MIRLDQVTKTYAMGSGGLTVLHAVDLAIGPNDFIGIVGPSGSGKSTLLHILGLLDRPTTGRYLYQGRDVVGLSDDERSRLRGRMIGFIFQSFHLLAGMTVVENVELPLHYMHVPREERRQRAAAALDRVGLSHRLDHRPGQLSGGERQRTAIARALIAEPDLILADEPTGNLDQKTGRGILELFDELHAAGKAIALITHDPAVANRIPRVYHIVDGRLGEAPSA